jgi:myo-inositol catabolism protein IolC
MALGYDRPLFILALDHRVPPHHRVFGVDERPAPSQRDAIAAAKAMIFDGFARAVGPDGPVDGAGILVDEELGADLARRAKANGWICAMPAERSGLPYFDLEYRDDFAHHIEAFDPDFVKILVRYNPDGAAANNDRSLAALAPLSSWLRDAGRKLMGELIVPAEAEQLAAVGGDPDRYDAELRPELTRRGILELQDAGVEPDVWKLEGIERREDCVLVAEAAGRDGRDGVGCVVLGRGADTERVEQWLRAASGVPGYLGFAIGRTLWERELQAHQAGAMTRQEAVDQLAQRYRRAIDVYTESR